MSRVTTPQTGQPTAQVKVAHDKIAMRAYEKWVKRGRPHGTSDQDWTEAETELKAEIARGSSSAVPAQAPQLQRR